MADAPDAASSGEWARDDGLTELFVGQSVG
jgi:hypothetical protein